MEALSEYALRTPPEPLNDVIVHFTSEKRHEKETVVLNKKGEKIETDLKVYKLGLFGLMDNLFTRNSTSKESDQVADLGYFKLFRHTFITSPLVTL